MKPMVILVLIVFALLFLQGLMSLVQYKRITRTYNAIKCRNKLVSVGRVKHIGRGCIAILGADEDGYIREGHLLKGLTVFAGFRAIKEVGSGIHYINLREKLTKRSLENAAVLQAIGFLEKGFTTYSDDDEEIREDEEYSEVSSAEEDFEESHNFEETIIN